MTEDFLLLGKREADDAMISAWAGMLEAEILGVLRTCRLELAADRICDRYEGWADNILSGLRPMMKKDSQAKEMLLKFGTTYSKGQRAELEEVELEIARRLPTQGRRTGTEIRAGLPAAR